VEAEADEGEVSTRLMFSKWDWMQLDRLVGTKNARKMVTIGAEPMFTFCCCLEEEKRRQEKTGQRWLQLAGNVRTSSLLALS
jgi:hypothetical protein